MLYFFYSIFIFSIFSETKLSYIYSNNSIVEFYLYKKKKYTESIPILLITFSILFLVTLTNKFLIYKSHLARRGVWECI